MPKDTKKDKIKSPQKPKKTIIPPDAFFEETGTKVMILESEEKEPQKDKKFSEEVKDSDKIDEKEAEKKTDDSEEVKEVEAKEVSDDVSSDTTTSPSEASFYEKVLGQKPPEKGLSDEEDLIEEREGLNRSLFFLGGVVFVLTILIASAIGFIFISTQNQKNIEQKEVIDAAPTETPTPTVAEIDRESITFEVLNGSGEGGKAGRTADAIKALGYTADVVGNADGSNYSGLLVGFSDDVTDEKKKVILSDLKDEFLSATEDNELQPDGTDVLVIIGR